jgi:hypothetical protein
MPYRLEEGWPVGNVVGNAVGRLGFDVGVEKVGFAVGTEGVLGSVGSAVCCLPGSTVTFTPPETVTVGSDGADGLLVGLPGRDGRVGRVGF